MKSISRKNINVRQKSRIKKEHLDGNIIQNDTRVIKAPKVLSLYSKEDADEILKHFNYSIFSSEKKVILDFRNTETITLSGGIFLHGYIKCLEHRKIAHMVKQSKLEKIQQIITYIQGTKNKKS